jgi:hypothetical protein
MARVPFARLLIVAALAAHSSCGGTRQDPARTSAAPRHEAVPAGARIARAGAGAHELAVAVKPAKLVASHDPAEQPPADAWAEHAAGEAAARAAFEQRFPLHGIAFHMQAQVFSEPNERGVVIGYLRRGTRFRAAEGKPGKGCDRAWHELASSGFVCDGRGFLLGRAPQSFEPSPAPAAVYDALPYRYAKNVATIALQYWRMPSVREEQDAMRLIADAPEDWLRTPAPSVEAEGSAAAQAPAQSAFALPDYARMPMEPGFYVSVDREELADASGAAQPPDCPDGTAAEACGTATDAAPRPFVRTVRGAFVPAQALSAVAESAAPGAPLGPELALPLGIVYRGSAKRLAQDALGGVWQERERLPRYAHVALTGERIRHEGQDYQQARSGELVSDLHLRVARQAARPPLVPKRARWIHVRLADQTLVAYDGDRPVFATLVATGKEGFATPQGLFRIHAKHVSATMDGLAGSDDVYSIEDVPWTMYFQGSYALHAAFWHDKLGAPRSHGCVNLSPQDAHWLFRFTTPELPAGWHGVVGTKSNPGTYVWIE